MSGIWEILKRYEPVLLPNTTNRLLFVYNRRREISGNAREFVFYGCKKNTGVYVLNSLFTSMEEFVKPGKTIQGKQHKTVQ